MHYRYYQSYANTLVALLFAYSGWRLSGTAAGFGWGDVGTAALCVVFFAGSRDTLRKYYRRGEELLGEPRLAPITPEPASEEDVQ